MPEISIPPGVVKTLSEATAVGRFTDTDHVRFYNQKPQKIGGWRKLNSTQPLIGIARSLYAYAQANRREVKIAGTESHLYAIDSANIVTDITPVGVLPGPTSTIEGTGYGTGPYGTGTYGTPRSGTGNSVPPRYWSLDNYGTWGLFCYQGGLLYKWDPDAFDLPQAWVGSPTDALYAFVTPERFIFVLCDNMVLRWPDRDNPEDWAPTSTNTANVRTLGTGSHLIAGCRLSGVSLIFSDTAVYAAQYTGGNSIYSTDMIGTNCGLVGPGAFCHEGGSVYWFGCSSFHMYAGQIGPIPNQDNILAWMLDNLDSANRVKMTCWFNPRFREVWWTFPSHNSVEPDLYVAVSLIDFEWIHGTLARVGATQQSQKSRLPILAEAVEVEGGYESWLYEHDLPSDKNADGEPLDWHYQVGLWRIPEAKQSVDIFGFMPDFEEQIGSIDLDVQAQDRPQSTYIDNEKQQLTPSIEIADLRVAGRYFSYRLSQAGVIDGDFRDGTHILEVQGAGTRR